VQFAQYEVTHGKVCGNMDLIVVDGIEITRDKAIDEINARRRRGAGTE
jgi:hypothetical protein